MGRRRTHGEDFKREAVRLILLLLAALATLSFHPPQLPLFADPTHAK